MQLEWKGHSIFLLSNDKGRKVLTYPFDDRAGLSQPKVDVVTVSHQHGNHNATSILLGTTIALSKSFKG